MKENIKILISAIVTMVGVAAAIGAAGIAARIFCRLFMYGWGIA